MHSVGDFLLNSRPSSSHEYVMTAKSETLTKFDAFHQLTSIIFVILELYTKESTRLITN